MIKRPLAMMRSGNALMYPLGKKLNHVGSVLAWPATSAKPINNVIRYGDVIADVTRKLVWRFRNHCIRLI
ncbi:MAG: hypothetical protein ACI89J_003081 [Hyphomicrobiaceae bacterium]|jgi:hypothetical protein